MRKILLLALFLVGCKQSHPKDIDLDAGKHVLAQNDPRRWRTYPTMLLLAVEHNMGVDTIEQVVEQFHSRFHGRSMRFNPQIPHMRSYYQEDVRPIGEDVRFFITISKQVNRTPQELASIISEFYLISGANRNYPEPNN